MQSDDVVSKGISGIQYMFGRQVVARGLTFFLGLLMTRALSPSIIGIANIQLQLILNIISILTRDAFRRACIRAEDIPGKHKDSLGQIVNVSWLVVPVSLVMCVVVTKTFYDFSNEEQRAERYFAEAVILTGVASFIEMLSEPAYILAQNQLMYRLRMYVELVAVLIRCLVVYIFVIFFDFELFSFGIGQLVYSIILLFGYFGYFFITIQKKNQKKKIEKKSDHQKRDSEAVSPKLTEVRQLFPKYLGSFNESLPSGVLGLVLNFEWQSIQKLVLQEGEKIVLTFAESLFNQGIYSVVNNLGSLVARFLFQPIEDVCYAIFSKLMNSKVKDKRSIYNAGRVLNLMLKFVSFIGLYFVSFGPGYSYLLLQLLYSEKYSHTSAPLVLSCYCFLVLCMAINGITEAFVQAVATEKEMRFFNVVMMIFSLVYIGTAYLLIHLISTTGLVLANCINMVFRIWFNGKYIVKVFKGTSLPTDMSIYPHYSILFSFFVIFIVGSFSSNQICSTSTSLRDKILFQIIPFHCIYHLFLGILMFLGVTYQIVLMEKGFLKELLKMWQERE